jgi:hypothetical protein
VLEWCAILSPRLIGVRGNYPAPLLCRRVVAGFPRIFSRSGGIAHQLDHFDRRRGAKNTGNTDDMSPVVCEC